MANWNLAHIGPTPLRKGSSWAGHRRRGILPNPFLYALCLPPGFAEAVDSHISSSWASPPTDRPARSWSSTISRNSDEYENGITAPPRSQPHHSHKPGPKNIGHIKWTKKRGPVKLGETLARARTSARYSQDDVGAVLGINRAMVSYWEAGTRTPNDRQLGAMAQLYGIELIDLVEGRDVDPDADDLASMLLRANDGVDPGATPGIREFVQFLDRFAELARIVDEPIRGLSQSPFVFRQSYSQKDDIRRKALPDIVQVLGSPFGDAGEESTHLETEFNEFEVTGVV